MKRLWFLLLPVLVFGDDLKSLLEYANTHNNLLLSSKLSKDAKQKELDSKNSAYFPTVDIGAFYQNTNERNYGQPGGVYSAYGKFGFDIYDGGKKSSLADKAKYDYQAGIHDEAEMKKSLNLQIAQNFYAIKSLQANLDAREDAGASIAQQLERIKKFYAAKLATKDDIDRLQASYDTNIYEIEALRFEILSAKRSLELKVGKSINTLEDSNFKERTDAALEVTEGIKSLSWQKSAVAKSAESIESIYYPQVRVEDTYSIYGYDATDAIHPKGVDNQNVLLLSVHMRIFDYGTAKDAKQAIELSSKALNEQIRYKTSEQKMNYELALSRIQTSKIKIQSARSALTAAKSAFKTIEQKYNAGIADYIVYLDALTSRTSAEALYTTSLNELETAYAIYYYYAGKNIEEYL
ncbi:TolC family protein [bacterium]|nr:TolC family protein [bacterium]MBU1989420.1 TolC family protein [bacterium]